MLKAPKEVNRGSCTYAASSPFPEAGTDSGWAGKMPDGNTPLIGCKPLSSMTGDTEPH